MKKAVLFLAVSLLMLMISCGDEQPTKGSNYVFDKRNIENDTNWVEFKDFDTLKDICFDLWDVYGGLILNSEDEYKDIFERAIKSINRPLSCSFWKITDYKKPDIDFENRSMLIFTWYDGMVEFKRKIYYNPKADKYFYLLTVDLFGEQTIGRGFGESLSLPKITNFDKIMFDTIYNKKWE